MNTRNVTTGKPEAAEALHTVPETDAIRRPYAAPALTSYGTVASLTRAQTAHECASSMRSDCLGVFSFSP